MKEIKKVSYKTIQDYEEIIKTNITFSENKHYDMVDAVALEECNFYRIILGDEDLERLFILDCGNFKFYTLGETCRLQDLSIHASIDPRTDSKFISSKIDLSNSEDWPNFEPILVTTNVYSKPLTAIDGNHRLMAHFLNHKSIENVPCYVYEHKNFNKWVWKRTNHFFIPVLARQKK